MLRQSNPPPLPPPPSSHPHRPPIQSAMLCAPTSSLLRVQRDMVEVGAAPVGALAHGGHAAARGRPPGRVGGGADSSPSIQRAVAHPSVLHNHDRQLHMVGGLGWLGGLGNATARHGPACLVVGWVGWEYAWHGLAWCDGAAAVLGEGWEQVGMRPGSECACRGTASASAAGVLTTGCNH